MRLKSVVLAVLLALAPAAGRGEAVRWAMPTEYPAASMPGEGLAAFAAAVARESAGRVEVAPSYDAALGIKSGDAVAALRAGRVQAADAFAGGLGATDAIFLLSSLPFVATTVEEAERLYGLAQPAYRRAFEGAGQHLLYVTPWPPSGVWSKAPLLRAEELKGLRIRVYDSTGLAVFRAAGAQPVELSFAAAAPLLKDGGLDAVLSSGDGGAGRRLWEVLPHFSEIGYAMPLSFAFVADGTWAVLPAADRDAVSRAAAEVGRRQWQAIRTRLAENDERMRANGVTIGSAIAPDLRGALAEAARGAVDEWRARVGREGEAILAAFRRQ